ncbi:MAG: MmcQ/YjbR family DNA-binding protein [Treponema sp.]|nr:MmcQ/YjbR family DNA-binding protein [Treponema sp.]
MDYSYIFHSAKIKKDSIKAAGFTTADGETYTMHALISNGKFNAEISLSLSKSTLTVHLFDSVTSEKYALFDMPNAHGAFVTSLREEVKQLIDNIKSKCFETNDLKDDYIAWIKSQFGVEPDYPWPDDAQNSFVFRSANQKWFALVMKIKYRQLGLSGDEELWGVNLKASQEDISNLIDKKSIFPALHMNKKHWITVVLTAVTDFEKLCQLTKKSYELVSTVQNAKKLSR